MNRPIPRAEEASEGALREAACNEGIMSPSASKIAIAVLLLGLPAAAARADGPPPLDVTVSCNAAARGAISAGRGKESCLADERTAQNTLVKKWSEYSAADKTQCIGNVKTGGPPSYVELLSCLDIMKEAKEIRETDPAKDVPAAGPVRRRR
jgi:hypothetical protein